ncbi:MAG: N-acetyl-alpha-D-glucosaminyl L-malate synthase BshA [Kofleriaceae bacterium]
MTRPLAIAVVCFPGLGGSGVIASELARGLAQRGHRVIVLATAMPERLKVNGVRFEQIDVPCTPVSDTAPYGLAVANQLVHLVRREAIDLVHLHYAIPHATSALLAAQVLGTAAPAMVVTLHGTDVTRLGAHPSLNPATAFALAACDGVTTPSQFLRREAAKCFGLAEQRIEVISNFVDVGRFTPPARRDRTALAALFGSPSDGPFLIHVSNLRAIKRPTDLVMLVARLRGVGARMVVVGEGPERAACEARARELGVADAMRFMGRRDDFEGLLAQADGFVLPSESESFGVAALEALASGVPVFGYEVGGVPEVVTPATGALVPVGNIEALATAILEGLGNRDALGRAGRERATALFRSEHIISTYEACFQRVLAARQGGPR